MRLNYIKLKRLLKYYGVILAIAFVMPTLGYAKGKTIALKQEKAQEVLKYVSAASYVEDTNKSFLMSKETIAKPFHLKKIDSKKLLGKMKEYENDVDNRTNVVSRLSVSKSGAIVDGWIWRDFYYGSTGLRFVLLQDADTKEYILAFGSTFAGGNVNERKALRTLYADIQQWLGMKPEIYLQAVDVARIIKSIYGDNVTLTGSSLGGALAVYAAYPNGIKAKGFATAPFAKSIVSTLLYEILEESQATSNIADKSKLRDGWDKIENFITKGDLIADISSDNSPFWALQQIGVEHIGEVFLMDPFNEKDSYMQIHEGSWNAIAKIAYSDDKYKERRIVVNGEEYSNKAVLKHDILADFKLVKKRKADAAESERREVEVAEDDFDIPERAECVGSRCYY